MKKLVILPTYNEAENIGVVIKNLMQLKVKQLDMLIVDDNSPDGTGKLADKLSKMHGNKIYVLHNFKKEGLGVAYMAGFKWAIAKKYDIVCEMDADGSHNPRDLPKLINAVEQGYDLAIGSRRVRGGKIVGWRWHRHLISWGATTLSRIVLRLTQKDVTAGFRAYTSDAIRYILSCKIISNGYAFQEETLWILHKNNFEIIEIPVIFTDRKRGESKLSPKDSKEFFMTLFRLARL